SFRETTLRSLIPLVVLIFGMILSSYCSCFLDHRQNVSRRVFEPGNRGTVPSSPDALFVRFYIRQIVMLKLDAALCQFVHGKIEIFDRKIQHCEGCRNMVRLWVDNDVVSSGEMQRGDAVGFRDL